MYETGEMSNGEVDVTLSTRVRDRRELSGRLQIVRR